MRKFLSHILGANWFYFRVTSKSAGIVDAERSFHIIYDELTSCVHAGGSGRGGAPWPYPKIGQKIFHIEFIPTKMIFL